MHNIIKFVWSLRRRKEEKIRFTTSHSPWEPSAWNIVRTIDVSVLGRYSFDSWISRVCIVIVTILFFFFFFIFFFFSLFRMYHSSNPICGLTYIYTYTRTHTRLWTAKHGGRPCRTGNKQRDTGNILHGRVCMYIYMCVQYTLWWTIKSPILPTDNASTLCIHSRTCASEPNAGVQGRCMSVLVCGGPPPCPFRSPHSATHDSYRGTVHIHSIYLFIYFFLFCARKAQ